MSKGEGKGWAKGRTAESDPWVARNAAAHRGRIRGPYRPRSNSIWHRLPKDADGAPTWSADLAYAAGLIATDGNLGQGRRITFTSADRVLVETFLRCIGGAVKVGLNRKRNSAVAYRAQVGDVGLYRWLRTIGITERKSLTLGAIDVPHEFFLPLVRGLLDGDGSIVNKVWRADTKDRADYWWEWLLTKFVSASRAHLEWLADRLYRSLGIQGHIGVMRARGRSNACYQLCYGKRASLILLARLYENPSAPCLERKRAIWLAYASRHILATDRQMNEPQQAYGIAS